MTYSPAAGMATFVNLTLPLSSSVAPMAVPTSTTIEPSEDPAYETTLAGRITVAAAASSVIGANATAGGRGVVVLVDEFVAAAVLSADPLVSGTCVAAAFDSPLPVPYCELGA